MKAENNNKWLDDALTKAVGSEKREPDFEKWRQDNPQAVEMLTSQANRQRLAVKRLLNIRNIIMKSPITKLAAAAVIIIAVTLGLTTILDKSVSPAYAIEQTIQASHSVRFLHIKDFKEGMEEPKEFWLEFGEQGNVKNIRAYMPEWESPSDGAKVVIWKEEKATVWFKKKNALLTIRDKSIADNVLKMAEEFDPKLAVQRLQEREKHGWVKIDVNESKDKTEPIVITATYLPESPKPHHRFVLLIDQATKLVNVIETYQQNKTGEYKFIGWTELLDYNQQIEPEMFALTDLPSDVMQVDQTTQEVGLVQGGLSDEEVAVEVARQFFEALRAMDYDKAGKLIEGIPGDTMRRMFGDIKVIRIISVGPAAPHPIPETKGLIVPCIVEIEKDGKISEWNLDELGVRQVYNQPGRWTIFGGI